MAITSAFQADDAGSIPAARSSFNAKSPLLRVGFLFVRDLLLFATLHGARDPEKRKGATGASSDG